MCVISFSGLFCTVDTIINFPITFAETEAQIDQVKYARSHILVEIEFGETQMV